MMQHIDEFSSYSEESLLEAIETFIKKHGGEIVSLSHEQQMHGVQHAVVVWEDHEDTAHIYNGKCDHCGRAPVIEDYPRFCYFCGRMFIDGYK